MQPRKCFYEGQLGYCWHADGRWIFQAVSVSDESPSGDRHAEELVGEEVSVALEDLRFAHGEAPDLPLA